MVDPAVRRKRRGLGRLASPDMDLIRKNRSEPGRRGKDQSSFGRGKKWSLDDRSYEREIGRLLHAEKRVLGPLSKKKAALFTCERNTHPILGRRSANESRGGLRHLHRREEVPAHDPKILVGLEGGEGKGKREVRFAPRKKKKGSPSSGGN